MLAVLALVVLTSGCVKKRVEVDVIQPVVVGSPGVTYMSTEANNSVDVVNNGSHIGSIKIGETVIYEGFSTQDIKNIGFFCDGMVTWETGRRQFSRTGTRNEYIYFVPADPQYQVVTKVVQVNCSARRKTQFIIRSVSKVR